MQADLTRRGVLGLAGAGAVAAATTMSLPALVRLAAAKTPTGADPFTLGVASGEPIPGGVVLWTRLAPDPLATDGSGGMPPHPFDVHWQVARDEQFRRVERQGTYVARPEFGHSVHVEVDGLRPGRDYYYRFRAGDAISPTGRTQTAPPALSSVALNFAVASCAMYEHGYFTAYRHLAEENPDVVVFLGDYIYEHGPNEYLSPTGNVRNFVNGHTYTLADYRISYAQ
jgi:alkaline phosphatase D